MEASASGRATANRGHHGVPGVMFLQPKSYLRKTKMNEWNCLKVWQTYVDDISDELSDQIVLRAKLFEIKWKRKLAELLLIMNYCHRAYWKVITACLLYLTLPATVASAERRFSKLKLIKTYLRRTISQVWLSSPAMLSIENWRLNDINTDDYRQVYECESSLEEILIRLLSFRLQ